MQKFYLFLFLLFPILSFSNNRYNIVNLTNNEGLSNSSINTICQDSTGLVWFGTWDGLNEYNSREFKIYKPEINNPNTIRNNIIRDILEENKEVLWIATDRGIDRFDRKRNFFSHFFMDANQQASPIEHSFLLAKNTTGRLFVQIYEQGLYYFDNNQQQFVQLDKIKSIRSKKIFFDMDDNLWIHSADKVLYKVTLKKGSADIPRIESIITFQHYNQPEEVFYNPQKNEIWLQNSLGSKAVYSISEGLLSEVPTAFPRNERLKAILFFDNYQLWGTNAGLFIYDIHSGKIETVLANIPVLSLSKGIQQIIWVGTDMQGVFMLSPSHENFTSYTSGNIPDFGKNAVRCFLENEKDELWVGTKGGGIYVFDNKEDKSIFSSKYTITVNDGLSSNSVFEIVEGETGEYWIGTDGEGLNYFDRKKNKIRSLHIPAEIGRDIKLACIYSILPTDNHTLWVGTSGQGMYRLEIDRTSDPYSIKSCKQYVYDNSLPSFLSNNIVYSIVKDDDNHLWIGTRGGGLNRFNIQTEEFQTYRFSANQTHHISNDDILCLLKDKSGTLWIGTSLGLNKLEYFEDGCPVFTRITENEGIPNNTIHGILEDAENNLWLSTNRGIAKLIPKEGQGYRIISYFQKDGLQNNEFSDGAYYKSSRSGDLYFGGISGFNIFNPLAITDNSYMPVLVLDAFYIQNSEANPNDYMREMRKGKTLVLQHSFKSVSFNFLPLDYLSGNKCEISYKLEGYNKDWIRLGTSSTIVFSNLPKGNYELKVRGSNADKMWSDAYFSLPIVMLPPWWASKWAFLSYLLIITAVVYIIQRQIKYRLAAKNEVKIKELEKQKTEEIHQAKLRFFTNIAHEFSNLLTLIYAPCEQLMKISGEDKVRKYVNTIRSNSQRMQSLIQQLIEFRKAETGFLKIQIETIDVSELIKFVIDNFLEMLEQKKIKLHLEFLPQTIVWNTDRDGLEKILFNLISNAVKYTPAAHTITLKAEIKGNHLWIEVTNTGGGIKQAHKNIIFDRFKVLERFEMQISEGFETRNGIGLALCKSIVEMLSGTIEVKSDEETYTTFVVALPQQEVGEENNAEKEYSSPILPAFNTVEADNVDKGDLSLIPDNDKNGLVLIIDDEKEIRQLLKEILSQRFEIAEAGDGKEAIEIMRVRMPLIIVCDVIMPNMNGVEFVQVMKNQELTRHIPIILLSSKSSIESQIEGIETGADAYLAKPFHPRHLEALIDSLVGRGRAVSDYNNSHYAGLEQLQGKWVHKEDKDLLLHIYRIVFENIDDESLSLEYIASEMAISRMQLYRKIKELTGQTPTEFIRSIRLENAEKLLKTTNKTVQEIMYCCGFNNKSYFYKEFSKKYQLTPKEYRTAQNHKES